MRRLLLPLIALSTVVGCTGSAPRSPRPATEPALAHAGPALPDTSGLTYTNLPTATRNTPRAVDAPKFGPPPPGYWRITGGSVPGWRPADMHVERTGANPWQLLGPRPITNEFWSGRRNASGRVVSVAPHPTDANTVYIGSASGGVWKTTDAGLTWVPLTDELASLNHGAVAIDPSNPDTIYAGTGEWTVQSVGDGLFRSLDGGLSWERIGTIEEVGVTCSRIIVDPTDPQTIHVTGGRGYVRSTDGGQTWTVQLSGSASDLALDSTNPAVLYVGRYGDGIYKSTDGGDTFTRLYNGLAGNDVRRVLVALAPSDPAVLYAVFINSANGLRGFYRSTNGGTSWSEQVGTPNFPTPQGWYDAFVIVDPADAATVYCGGVFPSYAVAGIIKSTDGGRNWTDITIDQAGEQVHPDEQAAAFGPDGTLWIGNDGGVWKSVDDGQHWINCNDTLTLTQNYQIALHPTDPTQVLGGTQDNGTVARFENVLPWPQIRGGDGGFLAYDHQQPEIRYITYVYLAVYRQFNGQTTNITGPWTMDTRPFIAPLVMDPNDSHTLYGGTTRVWKTSDAHADATWTAISPHSISGDGTLNAIAVAPSNSNVIYAGATSGRIAVTYDQTTWHNRTPTFALGQISDILIDPTDAAVAYVSSYRTTGPRIVRTEDYGLTWRNVSGDLPAGVSGTALEVDWRFDPPTLYLGTGAGVWESHDGGHTWVKDGPDLPNVNIGDLRIDYGTGAITAGTYGRGAWRKVAMRDCNGNGLPDADDIASGTSTDCNTNAIPDDCEFDPSPALVSQWPGEQYTLAQDFADIGIPQFSIKHWDDFTLATQARLTTGQAFFRPLDWTGFPHVGFLVEIADAPGGAEAGANVLLAQVTSGAAGLVTWDFGGATLPPGTYWVSVQALGGFGSYGMVHWFRANTGGPLGSEHYSHNPGGAHGFGPDPVPASTWLGTPADLALIQNVERDVDCNANGVLDECDLAAGTSVDLNNNGVPDECELPAPCHGDANCDGMVSWRDIEYFRTALLDGEAGWQALFTPGAPTCAFANNDADGDGSVTWRDVDAFVALINTPCP